MKSERERIYFIDYSTSKKPKNGTTVVITNGTTKHEIVPLHDETGDVPEPPK